MMEIQLQLIWTACIVSSVQLHNPTTHQAVPSQVNGDSEVRKSFQNLFESIAKNDTKKSKIFRGTLKEDVAREQQAFDAMREELRITHNRYVNRKQNYYKNNDANGNIVAAKREVKKEREADLKEDEEGSKIVAPKMKTTSVPLSTRLEYEEKFVELYGMDRMTSGIWELIREIPLGDEKLELLAKETHRLAGMGDLIVSLAVKESRWLDFYDPAKYNDIMIDVLVYAIQGHVKNDTKIPYFYYLTKGLRSDCVFYLTKENLEAMRLTLDKHVCGVRMPSP